MLHSLDRQVHGPAVKLPRQHGSIEHIKHLEPNGGDHHFASAFHSDGDRGFSHGPKYVSQQLGTETGPAGLQNRTPWLSGACERFTVTQELRSNPARCESISIRCRITWEKPRSRWTGDVCCSPPEATGSRCANRRDDSRFKQGPLLGDQDKTRFDPVSEGQGQNQWRNPFDSVVTLLRSADRGQDYACESAYVSICSPVRLPPRVSSRLSVSDQLTGTFRSTECLQISGAISNSVAGRGALRVLTAGYVILGFDPESRDCASASRARFCK